MLIWLDFLTPKQLFFLGELGKRLELRGHDVFSTTRKHREIDALIKLKNIDALVVGKYGGGTLEGKLATSAYRIERLSHIISKLNGVKKFVRRRHLHGPFCIAFKIVISWRPGVAIVYLNVTI